MSAAADFAILPITPAVESIVAVYQPLTATPAARQPIVAAVYCSAGLAILVVFQVDVLAPLGVNVVQAAAKVQALPDVSKFIKFSANPDAFLTIKARLRPQL